MSTTYSELLLFFFGRPAAKSNFIEKTTLKRPMRAKKNTTNAMLEAVSVSSKITAYF